MLTNARRTLQRLAWRAIGAPPRYKADFSMLDLAIKFVNHNTTSARERCGIGERGSLLGDYLEFGCAAGKSFIHAYEQAAPLMPWMRFWAFDSFQGLPRPHGIDLDGEAREGLFACDQPTFINNLRAAGVDLDRVVCVPGWYHETLTPDLKRGRQLGVASIVYIDCDLYHSAVEALAFVGDLVETGSVLIFDEWFTCKGDPARGEQRACAEWLAQNPDITLQDWHLFGPYGKSFIVARRQRESSKDCATRAYS
jgi:O-methyltransferase